MIARDARGTSPMTGGRHVVVVAAGDVPARDALDRAWPGWADGVDAVVAADGGLAAADALGLAPTVVVGDMDSADAARVEARSRRGRAGHPDLVGQGRVGHRARRPRGRAPRRDADHRPGRARRRRGSTTRSRTCGCWRSTPWAASRRPCSTSASACRCSRPRVRTASAAPCGGSCRASSARRCRCCPFGGDVEGVTTQALRYPLRGRAAHRRPGARPVQRAHRARRGRRRSGAAGCSSSNRRREPRGRPGRRRAILGAMSTPQAGDLAPEVALPDEHGTIHRLGDRAGRWTVVYFYPQDDTPGCTTEACQFRDLNGDLTGLDAEVWGISPDGSGSHAAFRAKFGLPFTLLSDEDHAVADAYGAWQEKQNYGKHVLGHRPLELPRRARRPDRPGVAEGEGRRARRAGPRGPRVRARRAGGLSVSRTLSRAHREASPVGGDERSLRRDSNTTFLRNWVSRRRLDDRPRAAIPRPPGAVAETPPDPPRRRPTRGGRRGSW